MNRNAFLGSSFHNNAVPYQLQKGSAIAALRVYYYGHNYNEKNLIVYILLHLVVATLSKRLSV